MLEQELAQLATAIQKAVAKHKETESAITRRRIRVRRRDFSLKYHEDFGFANFVPERNEQDVWDWRDQEHFQETVIKGLAEYKSLVSVVGNQASSLDHFVRSVSFASFNRGHGTEIADRVSAFGRELADQPLPVKVTAFLNGLAIQESPIVVSDRLIMRRPEPEDVAEYIEIDEQGGFPFPHNETWFRVVCEFVFDATSTGLAQAEFLRIVEALRLFRVGGIASSRYHLRSPHSFLSGGTISGGSGPHSTFVYALSNSDVSILRKFLDDIAPLLPDPFEIDRVTTERGIAYARYVDALFQRGRSERPITSAITALEALFLKKEPELTHRLAQRVSVFLRVLGTQPDARTTYDNVSKGYQIRSTFIHGGSVKPKDQPKADSLSPILMAYARECVLAFFQITVTKDVILEQLDRVMIDPASLPDLEGSFAPVMHR